MPFYCYLLECADGTLYTGSTNDLERRLQQHHAGLASRYTRSRRPVRLVYSETGDSRSAVMRRELEIKSWNRSKKLALVQNLSTHTT